jgi:hypothetical protein
MIKHIVVWRLKDRSKAESMKAALEALPAAIPQIRSFEVGICMEPGESLADIALVSTFESNADLQAYVVHPAHQKVVALIRELAAERRVADYVV